MSKKDSEKIKVFQQLTSLSMDITSTLDLDTLLKRIVKSAIEITNSQAGSILLFNEGESKLSFKVSSVGENNAVMQSVVVPMESVAGWVITHKTPAIIPDVSKDPRYFGHMAEVMEFKIKSLIAIPLSVKDKMVGVLELLNKKQGYFNDDDRIALTILGAQAAVAIENARLFNQADLLSELVHELRTPLTSIATITYLLQRSDTTEEQRKQWTNTILNEIERLNNFATNFLDLARLESGRTSLNRKNVDPVAIFNDCVEAVATKAKDRHVKIIKVIENNLPKVTLDHSKIKQVFTNLLCNAIKYNQPDGKVTLSARMMDGKLVVQIEDNGLGIDPEDMPFIFEKYYRGKSNENAIQGYGLGLPICKRIIDAHEGTIEVTSEPGKGTKFFITLPID